MKTFLRVALYTALALSVTACGGKKDGDSKKGAASGAKKAGGADVALDAGQKFLLGSGNRGLKKVKEAMKAGKRISGVDCAIVRAAIKKLDGVKNSAAASFVKDGKQTCEVDAPMANIKAWKTDIETEAKKGGTLNSKCFDIRKKDLEKLQKSHAADPTVKAIGDYYQATCKSLKRRLGKSRPRRQDCTPTRCG